jgi:uncharacterized YigZ family protein
MQQYSVPAAAIRCEEIIKGSRFISDLIPVDNSKQAKIALQGIRDQFPDATHHCWAYNAGPPGSTRDIGYSDDGEPHGTAGKPILNVLLHAEVGEILAVVTRYYGGTKLGTGGLARAYGGGAQNALSQLELKQKRFYKWVCMRVDYDRQGIIDRYLQDQDAKIDSIDFDQQVNYKIGLDLELYQSQLQAMTNLCAGKIDITLED